MGLAYELAQGTLVHLCWKDEIQRVRDNLDALEPAMRDMHICCILGIPVGPLDAVASQTIEEFSDSSGDVPRSAIDFSDSDAPGAELSASHSEGSPPPKKAKKSYRARAKGTTKTLTKTFLGRLACQWAIQKLYGFGDGVAQKLRQGSKWLSVAIVAERPPIDLRCPTFSPINVFRRRGLPFSATISTA